MKPCSDCLAVGPCYRQCACRKCLDPEAYGDWRFLQPHAYERWLTSQRD
jgi:hypothetical protein